jgi:lipoprotein signal peptidase
MTHRPFLSKLARVLILAGILMLVGCDHAIKRAAEARLKGQAEVKLLPGILDLRYTENHTMSFGMLGSVSERARRPVITVLHATALVVLAAAFRKLRHKGRVVAAGLCLALAGGAANLADRRGSLRTEPARPAAPPATRLFP